MALEKPRQQPAHCLFPTCSWALEKTWKELYLNCHSPFSFFRWRILTPYTCRFDMMRDDVERCCLLSLLILSASLLVFLLCVRGCQVHGAPQADPVECFFFCGRGIGKMRPAVWNKKYSIYVCHCESWHTCWAQYHWSAGWAGERFSAQRPRDDLALLGWLREAWCLPCFSNQLAGNDSAGQFFGDFAGASASIRSLRCVAQRTMDQVPYSVENYEGPTVRI